MKYVRIHSDENGRSHFADMELRFAPAVYSLAVPAVELSEPEAASQLRFLRLPAGWQADWHPAPAYQYLCILAGEVELTVGDGESRRFVRGDVILVRDITGQGHATRVIGADDVLMAVVQQA